MARCGVGGRPRSRGDPGNYRSRQEVDEWRARDPILQLHNRLDGQAGFDAAALEEVCNDEV